MCIRDSFQKLLLLLLETLDNPYEINKRCLPEVAIGLVEILDIQYAVLQFLERFAYIKNVVICSNTME